MKGLRRRQGKAQRQAFGLRLGEANGDAPVKGFTLAALMEACGTDLLGLRDAALLSLGYDAGLRVPGGWVRRASRRERCFAG